MEVSVIIPTYQRSALLFQALHSLQEQTLDSFEIFVVDNAHDRLLEDAVAAFNQTCRIPVQYLRSPEPGVLHQARHAGVQASHGDLVVFTDDDATFEPCWLEAYRQAFGRHEDMWGAGGPSRPIWAEPPPDWLSTYMTTPNAVLDYEPNPGMFPILSLMDLDPPVFRLGTTIAFFGVNMAVRRGVFDFSGFHPELYGRRTVGDGETGLAEDIVEAGCQIGYVPDAVVYHHIPVERLTVSYVRRYACHLAGDFMFKRWWKRKRKAAALAGELWRIGRESAVPWLKDWFVRRRTDPAALDIQFRAAMGWYGLKYWWWLLSDPVVQSALDQSHFAPGAAAGVAEHAARGAIH